MMTYRFLSAELKKKKNHTRFVDSAQMPSIRINLCYS